MTTIKMLELLGFGHMTTIKMLELLGFGHMTTSSVWFESRGKILLMMSWIEPLRGHKRFFKILLF